MSKSLIDGVLAGFGIAIPVGAIAVLIVTTAMRCGFACGASAGAGAATADLVYAAIAAVAGAAVADALAPWATPIKIGGAGLLVAIGVWGLFRSRPRSNRGPAEEAEQRLLVTYVRFLGLTIVNPLTVVYFTTVILATTAGTARTLLEMTVFVAGAFAASLSWQLLLASMGASARRGLPPRAQTATAVIGNLFILALAARILFQEMS